MTEQSEFKSRFHIGMRNVKTGLSVFVCLLLYRWIGRDGYFLACASAIICMQGSIEKSVSSGLNRILGTACGALLGMGLLYLNQYVAIHDFTLFTATVGIILYIFFCNVIGKPDAIVIGCVVLLAIVLQQTDQSPFVYAVDRCIDTFSGIFVAILINRFIRSPGSPHNDGEAPGAAEPPPAPDTPAADNAQNSESDLHTDPTGNERKG